MIANRLSALLASLHRQVRLAGQIRIVCCLLLVIGPLSLLASRSIASKAETSGAQVVWVKSLWQSLSVGFVEGLREVILTLLVMLLALCLLGLVVVTFRRLRRMLPKQLESRIILLGQKRHLFFLLGILFLVVLVLMGILLLKIIPMSPVNFVLKYMWELFVSVVLFVLLGGLWRLLGRGNLLNDSLRYLDRGEITEAEANEAEQLYSLQKWLKHEDITGFFELREAKLYGNGLAPRIRSELSLLLREKQRAGTRANQNGDFVKYLQSLLTPSSS